MFRTLGFALLLAGLPGACAAQAAAQRAGESAAVPVSYASAKALAEKGRLDGAMAELNQLAAQSPVPAGVERLRIGLVDPLDFAARPRWPLDPDAPAAAGAGVKA